MRKKGKKRPVVLMKLARNNRSSWKVALPLLFRRDVSVSKRQIWNRSAVILSEFVGKRIEVYNGRRFISRAIKRNMVGLRVGEVSYTKSTGSDIHQKKRKGKKKKK